MNIFFDTEFTGLHQKTTLISVGLIAESGESFYGEFIDYDHSQINEWLQENVVDRLKWRFGKSIEFINHDGHTEGAGTTEEIKKELSEWLLQFDKIEIWSDCLSYDWVLFCNIFGDAFSIPKNIYYIPFDLSTLLKVRGINPDINREQFVYGEVLQEMKDQKHNALWDAKVIKRCFEKLNSDPAVA